MKYKIGDKVMECTADSGESLVERLVTKCLPKVKRITWE